LGNILQIYWNTAVCFPVEFVSYWCSFQTQVFRVTYLWAMFHKPANTNQTSTSQNTGHRAQSKRYWIWLMQHRNNPQDSCVILHLEPTITRFVVLTSVGL